MSIEEGFSFLMQCVLKPPLTHITFTQNQITNKGGEALFNCLLSSSTIEFVSLAENRVNDEFSMWLQRFIKEARIEHNHASITQIELQDNGLTKGL